MDQTLRLKATTAAFTSFVKGWFKGTGVPVLPAVAECLNALIDVADCYAVKADVFPGIDGSAACVYTLDSPGKQHYVIHVSVRADGKFDVSVARWLDAIRGELTNLVGGANFDMPDAVEMATAWFDIARSGRADKRAPITIFG